MHPPPRDPGPLDLRLVGEEHRARVGTKALSLARLLEHGFRVPAGVVFPTDAYWMALEEAGLARELLTLQGADGARELCARIEALPLPDAVEEALRIAYEALTADGVAPAGLALRSSGTAEDLPDASFAGLHDTYLALPDLDALQGAVPRAWASLYSPRAVAYRRRLGLDAVEVAPALILQRMVAAEASGVLFTVDPLTGLGPEMVISATWGLGEGLVSGRVDPDRIRVDRETLRPVETRPGAKATRVVPDPTGRGGTRTEPTPAELRGRACLSPEQIATLAACGARLEEWLGGPQDIEWALAGGKFHLLQARPVTRSLPVPPRPEDRLADVYVWSYGNFAETMPEPPSPMGWSIFGGLGELLLRPPFLRAPYPDGYRLFDMIRGRPYWNLTPLFEHPRIARHFFEVAVAHIDHTASHILLGLLETRRVRVRRAGGWPRKLLFLLQLLVMLPLVAAMLALEFLWPQSRRRQVEREVGRLVAELEGVRDLDTSPRERLRTLRSVSRRGILRAALRLLPPLAAVIPAAGGLRVMLHRWLGLEGPALDDAVLALAAGERGNLTQEAGFALADLARVAREEGLAERVVAGGVEAVRRDAPGSRSAGELDAFLTEYGHRGPLEQDLETPRWSEDPSLLDPLLCGLLAEGREPPDSRTRRREAQQATARLEARCLRRLREESRLPVRAWIFTRWLARARLLFPYRENGKHYLFRALLVLKQVLLRVEAELVAGGLLRCAGDVFYLTLEELCEWVERGCPDAGEVRRRVLCRRVDRLRDARLTPPMVLLSTGEEFFGVREEATEEDGRRALVGVGASPGRVSGRVRVLRHPREADRLRPGEVLVAPHTDPGWTPLFLTAGALVMEVGGVLSHGAVVAREYGVPAVVGVAGALERLRDGQRVTVDASRGRVIIHDESDPPEREHH